MPKTGRPSTLGEKGSFLNPFSTLSHTFLRKKSFFKQKFRQTQILISLRMGLQRVKKGGERVKRVEKGEKGWRKGGEMTLSHKECFTY